MKRRLQAFLMIFFAIFGVSCETALEKRVRQAREAAEGAGLGLSICRAMASLMGGQATIASQGPGKGTVATLTLPGPTVQPSGGSPL